MTTVISVENLTKRYDLGVIGTGTLSRDLNRWWARLRHQPDPYTKIGQEDHFKRIGESILALDDVSFTVQQGEALGIIGRNGAGKSTLLKILSRVTAPTIGVVKVKGRIGSLLEVGTGFHPELTGRENVYLNGAILGMRKDEVAAKFDEIVDFSGVEKFIDTPVKRYSSGMYVRLAFAVAAHLDPEILVVDEVLAVGDAEFQKKCLGKMGDVASEGRTVLFVSHNMAAIQQLCEKAILLNNGSIIERGYAYDTVERYLLRNKTQNSSISFSPEEGKPMRLREIAILRSDDKQSEKIEIGSSFTVSVKYDVNERIKNAHVICLIMTNNGVNILSTGDADTKPERFGIRLPGEYHGRFTIPANLLGEGLYYLTISLGIPFVQVFDRHESVISFEIIDFSSERRKTQHRRRPGILGIDIPWEYEISPEQLDHF